MRHTRRLAAMSFLCAFTALTVAAWRPEKPKGSGLWRLQADNWVLANRGKLPSDFETYAGMTMPHRRAIYRELSWAAREDLWRRHVETFLLPQNRLSPLQKAMVSALGGPLSTAQTQLVLAWRDSVIPRAYRPGLTDQQRQAVVGPFCEKAKAVLGADRSHLIFGQIGPTDSTYTRLLRAEAAKFKRASMMNLDAAKAVIRIGLAKAGLYQGWEVCWCAVSSACDCGIDAYCVNSNCQRSGGCGCGGVWACDGRQCAF